MRNASLIAVLAAAFLTAGLTGCQKSGDDAAEKPATAETSEKKAAQTAKAPAAAEDAPAKAAAPVEQTYRVKITPGDASAGNVATSVVEVTPAAGYKMNLDFPSRLALQPLTGAKADKTEFGKDDCQLTEQALRFEVPFTPEAAGKLAVSAMADFSVCNESACKLIRDEKLAWEVAVR